MKKVLLTFLCAMMTMMVGAKDYTEMLSVTINGESTEPQPATVHVTANPDGTINFALDKFTLVDSENEIPVGNIAVYNLAVTKGASYDTFSFTGNTVIAPGDNEGFWLGPTLEEVPLVLNGKMTDEKLYVTIDIDFMDFLGQMIFVKVGEDIQGGGSSKDYTEMLTVTINGESTEPQPATVQVTTNPDGTINFALNKFTLVDSENEIPVGNIAVYNLAVTKGASYDTFSFTGNTVIAPGDDEGFWLGPTLEEVPLVLNGKMTDSKLYVTIDIDFMDFLGQMIFVQVGDDNFKSEATVGTLATKIEECKNGTATKADVESVIKQILKK